MIDPYAEALGLAAPAKSALPPEADLDALWGYPPGFLNAAQWLFCGERTAQEMLAAMKALELQMTQRAAGPRPAPADSVSTQERMIVRRSIRRGQGGRIRVVAGGRGHA